MRFRDGTGRQQAIFALLILTYLTGLGLTLFTEARRIGTPTPGIILDGNRLSPMRKDVQDKLGRGGLTLHAINDTPIAGKRLLGDVIPLFRRGEGEANDLTVRLRGGELQVHPILVLRWTWDDVWFSQGSTLTLGAFFMLVGLVAFLTRPYEEGSWAVLAQCAIVGSLLSTAYASPLGEVLGEVPLVQLCFRTMVGLTPFVLWHAGLAFPVVAMVLRGPRRLPLLGLIYGLGALNAALQVTAAFTDFAGILRYIGVFDTSTLMVALLFVFGRTGYLAFRSGDPLVRQRANILLGGIVFGGIPVVGIRFLENTFDVALIEQRRLFWFLAVWAVALGYTTVKYDLLNARVALRRAIIYGVTVGALTVVAMLLVSVQPYAVALLLIGLLYFWPRLNNRLNEWLYPKRAARGALIREIGEDLAACTSRDEILQAWADSAARITDATSCVVFLFPESEGVPGALASAGTEVTGDLESLAADPLIQMVATTRKEIPRDIICVDPQYTHIRDDCYACFDRLHATVVLPITRGGRAMGVLGLGSRAEEEPYEAADLDAMRTVGQQAVQAMVRVEATERLHAREMEFAGLNRFLSPQIIDQVMATGGAVELRSRRKLVTVFFADLRGFTSFSDSVEPEEVMATLAEYHAAMGRRIQEYAGTLERFAGDGFMVFFNDPVEQPDHVVRAAQMALAMRDDIAQLHENWVRKGYDIDAGMGIHTGYATCGFIGYEGRRDYGVIGNVTNMAARLSDAAAGGEILVSARVVADLANPFATEPVGELTLKGFHQAQATHRILGVESKV